MLEISHNIFKQTVENICVKKGTELPQTLIFFISLQPYYVVNLANVKL